MLGTRKTQTVLDAWRQKREAEQTGRYHKYKNEIDGAFEWILNLMYEHCKYCEGELKPLEVYMAMFYIHIAVCGCKTEKLILPKELIFGNEREFLRALAERINREEGFCAILDDNPDIKEGLCAISIRIDVE